MSRLFSSAVALGLLAIAPVVTPDCATLVAQQQDQKETQKEEKQDKPRRRSDLITREEILSVSTQTSNLGEAIRRLRPAFFNIRGVTRMTDASGQPEIQVYVNGIKQGTLSALDAIPLTSVTEVRKLSAGEASSRFGTNHMAGAIVVTTGTGND